MTEPAAPSDTGGHALRLMPLPGRAAEAVLGAFGLGLTVFLFLFSVLALDRTAAIVLGTHFAVFTAFFVIVLRGSLRCEVVVFPEGVLVRNRLRTYDVLWSEIERIEPSGVIVSTADRRIRCTALRQYTAGPLLARTRAEQSQTMAGYRHELLDCLAQAREGSGIIGPAGAPYAG